jgi:hypothetical protein
MHRALFYAAPGLGRYCHMCMTGQTAVCLVAVLHTSKEVFGLTVTDNLLCVVQNQCCSGVGAGRLDIALM